MIPKSAIQTKILDSTFYFVCTKTGIPLDVARSKRRKGEIVRVRQMFSYLVRKHFRNTVSLELAGSYFGQDHATVINSVKKISNLIETDKNFRNFFKAIEEEYIVTTVDAIKRQSKYAVPQTKYLQVKQQAEFETERANLMYYEALKLIGKVTTAVLKDNVMEGFRKHQITNDLAEYKTKISQLKMEKLA